MCTHRRTERAGLSQRAKRHRSTCAADRLPDSTGTGFRFHLRSPSPWENGGSHFTQFPRASQCPLFMAHESAHARRIAATATSLAALAAVATGGLLWGAARSGHARAITTTERIPDEGEDFFTAVEQPHKIYEFPWLRDQKFQYEARLLGYGPSETWDRQRNGHTSHDAYMGFNEGYKRTAYDEYGDRAFDVDMRPAQGCYDDDSWDCYREQFNPDTGYLRPSA